MCCSERSELISYLHDGSYAMLDKVILQDRL
jgi:hypothetical protein